MGTRRACAIAARPTSSQAERQGPRTQQNCPGSIPEAQSRPLLDGEVKEVGTPQPDSRVLRPVQMVVGWAADQVHALRVHRLQLLLPATQLGLLQHMLLGTWGLSGDSRRPAA